MSSYESVVVKVEEEIAKNFDNIKTNIIPAFYNDKLYLKTLTNPIVKANTTAVNPKVTPKMCGIVFFIPKLKPE